MYPVSRMVLIATAIFSSSIAAAADSLVGRWSIDSWTWQDGRPVAFDGSLTILEIETEGGLVGEFVLRRLEGRVRQKMRISVTGDDILMSGEMLRPRATGAPDTLTLTLSGNRLTGTSTNAHGQSGAIKFRRHSAPDFPASCDAYAFFTSGSKAELVTEQDARRELASSKKTPASLRALIPIELARKRTKLERDGKLDEVNELVNNSVKLDAMLGCIERGAL